MTIFLPILSLFWIFFYICGRIISILTVVIGDVLF